eukprot:3129702-Rhodomonas_salina.1
MGWGVWPEQAGMVLNTHTHLRRVSHHHHEVLRHRMQGALIDAWRETVEATRGEITGTWCETHATKTGQRGAHAEV